MEIIPLGDSALIVRLREQFDDAPEETLDRVLNAFQRLRSDAIPGVIELAPAYTSVAVFFDPIAVTKMGGTMGELFDGLAEQVRKVLTESVEPGSHITRKKSDVRLIEIPVCYDAEFAPDLDDVARHARISPKQVVDLHSAAEYRVACIGFVPGFPFLTGLPKPIATPRRSTPRKQR